MYVRAGFFDWRPLPIEGGTSERDRAELADRARAYLLDWLGDREDEADDAELDAELAEALGNAEADLPFLVLPPEAATTAVVADLSGRWPDVPLMLRCGADTAEEFERRALGEIGYLRPPVDSAREAEVLPLRRSKLLSYMRRAAR